RAAHTRCYDDAEYMSEHPLPVQPSTLDRVGGVHICPMNPIPPYTTSSASGWSLTNPKHVVGINAAVEYCDWTETTCTLTNTWPRATFDWPPGMPRTMYIGTSKVDVTDAQGLTTRYGFTAYDLALKEGGVVADGYVPGQEYSPRLTSISPPNASNRIKV